MISNNVPKQEVKVEKPEPSISMRKHQNRAKAAYEQKMPVEKVNRLRKAGVVK